ncbi:endonuclease/exonuclease/phosphatase family protein [Mycetocola manganoxydans]|uniref:Endonuclease/exonuclease/phosphatase family protein n=1 Tax=Mycetocola manganoxydans TaxID=699879 RepID=A0A3L6ZSK4_9MICO|nr:endonuclease/exonuclease/phosphatase family protein [Mycetocola manganoxydans]RLP70789.1 endonuclease/exonuclease/phosphatase family protein [Mycetocola manganoxydans]GHD48310.1 endonuclease [Mycetocola manganoxydans]
MLKVLGALATVAIAVLLLVCTWPQFFGLQTTWIVAQITSMRSLVIVASVLAAVIFALLALARPLRAFAGTIVLLLLVFAGANAAIAVNRGLGDTRFAEDTADSITVLSWNTLGDAPGADAVARLAVESSADVLSLPETTQETGIEIAERMRDLGRPMWVLTEWFDQISPARSTTILISPELGDYVKVTSNEEREENTTVLPTIIVEPVDGDGPTFIAAHAVAPITGQMENWRNDLSWLAEQCAGGSVIMAGDFNATLDNMAGLGATDAATLGECVDAGEASGNGAVGTWPTGIPALVGAPIDHVMATPDWDVTGMRVITETDDSGSDHRPVLVQLSRAPQTG